MSALSEVRREYLHWAQACVSRYERPVVLKTDAHNERRHDIPRPGGIAANLVGAREVHLIEYDPDVVREAQQRCPGLRIHPGDIRRLPFDDGAFHVVLDLSTQRASVVYDAAGQRQATVNPLGFRTTNLFDPAGQRTAVVDANGNRSSTVYDAVGRSLAVINALQHRTTTLRCGGPASPPDRRPRPPHDLHAGRERPAYRPALPRRLAGDVCL